jgi:hypothetical protein
MSEPFLEPMSRFTPSSGTLDRDALLFAAGRASARPNRAWVGVASVLAGTQVLSLALLWPGLPDRENHGANAARDMVAAESAREPMAVQPAPEPDVWTAHQGLRTWPRDDRPDDDIKFIETAPPLRAFGTPPASLLN